MPELRLLRKKIRKYLPFKKTREKLWRYYLNIRQHVIITRENIERYFSYFRQQEKYRETVLRIWEKFADGGKVRIGFFIIYDSVFSARPLYEAMLQDEHFYPFIIVAPDVLRGIDNMIDQSRKTYDSLSRKYKNVYVGYDEVTGDFIDFSDRIDMAYFASPYDEMTHEYFTVQYLMKKCILPIHTNYGYLMSRYSRKISRLPSYNYFWKVFTESEKNMSELKRFQPLKGRNAVVSGYCKMDGLAAQKVIPRTRKRIIIAPHHAIPNSYIIEYSNFLEYADLFLELPQKYPDIDFVFRPHPLLFITLRKVQYWGNEKVDKYLEDLLRNENIMYSTEGEYLDIFANSDGMIHDCGSFLAEYLFTGKPACYMLKNRKVIKKNLAGSGLPCLKNHYKAYNEGDILSYINNVIIQGNDSMERHRIDFVEKKLKVNYPNVANFIKDYIKKEIGII
jgi:hypothetical protein